MSDADRLARLVGAPVFGNARDLRVHIRQADDLPGFYEAYARASGTMADFDGLVSALALHRRSEGPVATGGLLPAPWQPSPGVQLPWWDASPETPETSAARRHGNQGWIVAKYEDGRIFLIATDMSHP